MKKFLLSIVFLFIQTITFGQRVRYGIDIDDDLQYNISTPFLDRILLVLGIIFVIAGFIMRIILYIKEDPKQRAFRKEVKKAAKGGWVYIFSKDITIQPHWKETLLIPKGTKCIILGEVNLKDFVIIRICANQSIKYDEEIRVSYSILELIDKCE